jgi:hypothetical protein
MTGASVPDPSAQHARWASNPVVPALIAASVALAGVTVGALLNVRQTGFAREAADRQRTLEVARIKRDVVAAVNEYDLPTAKLLMAHVLGPIDDAERFQRFSQEFLDLVATKAAGNDPRAKALAQQTEPDEPSMAKDPAALVSLFDGPERLLASNALIELHKARPADVVGALVGAILPEADRRSYRVNLYIAYTLSRLQGGWLASASQLDAMRGLMNHRSYSDSTFRARVNEALRNTRNTTG